MKNGSDAPGSSAKIECKIFAAVWKGITSFFSGLKKSCVTAIFSCIFPAFFDAQPFSHQLPFLRRSPLPDCPSLSMSVRPCVRHNCSTVRICWYVLSSSFVIESIEWYYQNLNTKRRFFPNPLTKQLQINFKIINMTEYEKAFFGGWPVVLFDARSILRATSSYSLCFPFLICPLGSCQLQHGPK